MAPLMQANSSSLPGRHRLQRSDGAGERRGGVGESAFRREIEHRPRK